MSVFSNRASAGADDTRAYVEAVLGLLGSRNPVDVLRETPAGLRRAMAGLSPSQITAPEAPGKWSIRHVIKHMSDAELVWGYRVRMALTHERPQLTGYDQDLWADRLRYHDADAEQAFTVFNVLRETHVRMVAGLSPADLKRVGVHAERGDETVEHMIRLYAGHDLLHLRQLDRIRSGFRLKPEATA